MTPHVYIVGQTASGKTSLALDLASDLNLEILNTDSLLFYKGLDVGTAKPSSKERDQIRHHLIDVCELGEELSAADYARKAKPYLDQNSKSLLCVGGSGFYVRALDVGLLPLPHTDPQVKKQVESLDDPVGELRKVDPQFFLKTSENDLYRVKRALEVYVQTGRPLSVWQKNFDPKPRAKKVAFSFDREDLLKRVRKRTELMIKEGLIEEVEQVLQKTSSSWRPLSSVGYLETRSFLSGEIKTKTELAEEIIKKTMQLAKKQKTWFKKDTSVKWFDHSNKKIAYDYVKKNILEDSWKA